MDIEKLIELLQNNRHPNGLKSQAATALSTLQIENQALRNSANGFKAENEKLRAELEQVRQLYESEKTDSLIQELRYHARHSKDGKMSEECIVPKTLLADAADQLKKFCQTRAGNGNSLDGSPTTG